MLDEKIIHKLSQIQHGFKPIEQEAAKLYAAHAAHQSYAIACQLIEHDLYQIRSLGIFLLGHVAAEDFSALEVLKSKIGIDPSWQVQEILAKAFDCFCMNNGYEKSLPIIEEWLQSPNPNVCRAVTEGLRIWTSRPFFAQHPEVAIRLISQHRGSDSPYLRKSVGNSLRDISKKHRELVEKEIATWNLADERVSFTYKYAMKSR